MKKLYIPTEEELEQLQSFGVNIYYYMISKTIETLIMQDIVYDDEYMFDVAYETLAEFPEIINAIARIYPEKIQESERASRDIKLCTSLTESVFGVDKSIYYLDNLTYFNQEQDGPLFHPNVIAHTARILANKLSSCPRYRFEYKESNALLDSMFVCELPSALITPQIIDDLMTIDPIYAIKLNEINSDKKSQSKKDILFSLTRNMIKYNLRYGLDGRNNPYQGQDIIAKPNDKVKKLIRCLDEHRIDF